MRNVANRFSTYSMAVAPRNTYFNNTLAYFWFGESSCINQLFVHQACSNACFHKEIGGGGEGRGNMLFVVFVIAFTFSEQTIFFLSFFRFFSFRINSFSGFSFDFFSFAFDFHLLDMTTSTTTTTVATTTTSTKYANGLCRR